MTPLPDNALECQTKREKIRQDLQDQQDNFFHQFQLTNAASRHATAIKVKIEKFPPLNVRSILNVEYIMDDKFVKSQNFKNCTN